MNLKTKKPSYDEYVAMASKAFEEKQHAHAFDYSCHALQSEKAGHVPRVVFALTIPHIKIVKFDPIIRNAIINFLKYDCIDNNKVFLPWLQMLEVDPNLKSLLPSMKSGIFNHEEWPKIENTLNDELFTEGLRRLIISSPVLELFLRFVRRSVLLELWPAKILKTKNLPFLCALAEQCFLNEYVYFVTDEEKEAIKLLPKNDPIAVAILGCYEALYTHNINPKLSAVAGFKKMVAVQIYEPLRERELMNDISSTTIDNTITKNVQAMYEENPYPRWKSIDIPTTKKSELRGSVLLAGCGTGRTATQMGFMFPHMNTTACDISRRSIAYAKRMAEKFGNTTVTFEHRDIMTLQYMQEKFDFVECSGVLHHMADPVAGWKQLVARVADGGYMLICLYSTKARANIQAVRELVAAKGLKPVPEDIRKIRKEIIEQNDHPLRKVLLNRDFYTLSEMRDLVFHIQEKTYTLLELKAIMDDIGVEFVRLKMIDPYYAGIYRERFPEDPDMVNLEYWDKMEDDYPDIFLGMYKFICKRKGDDSVNFTTQELLRMIYSN